MVTPVTSFGRSGVADFVLQRASAVVLAVYALLVFGYFLFGAVEPGGVATFFGSLPMRIFSTLALAALAAHGWIGMWTVGTDYVREHYFGRSHSVLQAAYQLFCLAAVFVYLVWPLSVIWGWGR